MARIVSREARKGIFSTVEQVIADSIRSSKLPTRTVNAGTTIFRKIHTIRTVPIDLRGQELLPDTQHPERKIWRPGLAELLQISPGAPRADHRWSGPLPNGQPGIGGSYWGSLHGVIAEDYFYRILEEIRDKPDITINPLYVPLLLLGRKELEKHIADLPTTIPVNGGDTSDILVGRLKRNVTILDMHPASDAFRAWDSEQSRLLKAELDSLGYDGFAKGLADTDDRILSRFFGNVASKLGYSSIGSPSPARTRGRGHPGTTKARPTLSLSSARAGTRSARCWTPRP